MSYLRTAHEREAYRRTFYRDTDVYINKLGIRDQRLLEETERALTDRRAAEGFPPRAHRKTYAGFKAIHRHLFQDLYRWAGRERNYTTGRGAIPLFRPTSPRGWRACSVSLHVTAIWLAAASGISRQTPQGM